MSARPVKVAFLADTADLRSSLAKAETSMDDAANTARSAGERIDGAFDSTAESADNVASKGSQAAGALSGLGDLVGGKFGSAMMVGGIGMQAFADAGDLLNVVTESAIIRKAKDIAITTAHAVASKVAAGAQKAWTAAQWALNAAMSANPIALVVLAIVALVAAFVIAYRKSETFRKIVNGVFDKVKRIASSFAGFFTRTIPGAVGKVVDWVKGHWPKILAIMAGPIGLVVLAVTKNFDKIRDKFSDLVGWVRDVPGKLMGLVGRFTDAGGHLIQGLINGLSHMGGTVANIATAIVNDIIGYLNRVLPHQLTVNKGLIHLSVPLFPEIPALASGGIVTGPTLALVGEAGPEAVIPLKYLHSQPRQVTINLNVATPVGADPYTIGETIVGFIREYEAGGGF